MKILVIFFMLMLSFSVDGKPRSPKQESVIATSNSEPETYKMVFAGVALIAYMARRRFQSF